MAKTESSSGGLKQKIADFREKHAWFDRLMRMQEQYTRARGNHLAGAVTYFGFLSLFPLLAVAFAILGYISSIYASAQTSATQALTDALGPEFVGEGKMIDVGQLAASGSVQGWAGLIGAAGLLYAGLGWLDAMREALRQMWAVEPQQANMIVKKLKDVFLLVVLGTAVLLSAAISTLATGFTGKVLEWVGLSGNVVIKIGLVILGIALAIAATTLVMTILFARLPGHKLPWKNVLTGALFGAIGIEIIKTFGSQLISGSMNNPAYATFGIVVGMLVYINFVSRVVMYSAAWCVVGPVKTVEEEVSREGETLSQGEAEAASEARDEHDDDESVRLGTKHGTTAGDVPVTTTGVPAEKGKTPPSTSTSGKQKNSGAKSGSDSASSASTKREVVDLRERQTKAQVGADSEAKSSKGSVLSFAGVMALVALRKRGQAKRGS